MIKSGDLYIGFDMITIMLCIGDHYIGKCTYRACSIDCVGQFPTCVWSAFQTEIEQMDKLL